MFLLRRLEFKSRCVYFLLPKAFWGTEDKLRIGLVNSQRVDLSLLYLRIDIYIYIYIYIYIHTMYIYIYI